MYDLVGTGGKGESRSKLVNHASWVIQGGAVIRGIQQLAVDSNGKMMRLGT